MRFPMVDSAETYIDWKNWRNESFGQYSAVLASYYAIETGSYVRPGVDVLEIGFGNGSFIGWARDMGATVYGVELNAILVERAGTLLGMGRAFQDLNDESLTERAGTFAVIVAFDVIEHIATDELPRFFRRMRSLLEPNGRLIVRFPNGDSPFGRIYQHGDPTHLSTIGSQKVRYFAENAGLKVEAVRAPSLPLAGNGIERAIKRWLLKSGRRVVERIVGYLYFGGRVIPLDPNYVAILVPAETQPSEDLSLRGERHRLPPGSPGSPA
jgi:2-polyprenyl-3-methyl-5-hydroxy-6-metoxy-1,4-benzoquinol methylase